MVRHHLIYLDGKFVPSETAKVSVFDHGLLYGDGIFEGIRAYDGMVFQLDAHLDRLYDCAKVIWLQIPLPREALKEAVLETLRRNELANAYVRLVVTRGKGDLGLDPRKCSQPSVIIIAQAVNPIHGKKTQERGIRAIITSIRRHPTDTTSHEIKSLNYLNSILARLEAISVGVDEAIMLDHRGFVAEAAVTTLFVVRDGQVQTPPLHASILNSITRRFVIDLARDLGYQVQEQDLTVFQLRTADEVFLCGTLGEAIPVTTINAQTVGTGLPGPVTQKIIDAFVERRKLSQYGTPIATSKSVSIRKRR